MNALPARRFYADILLVVLALLPCQAYAKESTTEDPSQYPSSWYRISLDWNGRYTSGDGQGYGNGTWYSYPATGWYRQWFYYQPFDAAGKGYLQYDINIRAIDSSKPTTLEVSVNWTTPEWSQIPAKQPPQSKDVPSAADELKYMMSRGLYRVDNQTIKPTTLSIPYTVERYCPEWVSVDIRGKNAHVYGGVIRQTLAQLDFGDAPDTYKTLAASNGPRHTVVQGVCLGRTIDAESDGTPGPAANGDDLNGTADEDGVVFTSPLSPGEPATIEVTASTQGYLTAWVDFNLDGTFAGADERVFQDQLLTPGVNRLSFPLPTTAAHGATLARFRFSTRGQLSYFGPAADGEVEDYQVTIGARLQPQLNSGKGGLKWSQAPQQFDPATPFILNGWGQLSDLHLHQVAADDWRCDDEQPITGFQWYGSFQGWTQPALPQDRPLAFHIALWTDSTSAHAGDTKASNHPGTIIWETFCTHWTWNVTGYYSDPKRTSDDASFQFTCLLSQDQWFRPSLPVDANAAAVYWLSITAFYDPNAPAPEHPWGWTTRPQFFGAGAVQIDSIEPADPRSTTWPPSLGSRWKSGRTVEFPRGTAWDYAFELLTNQVATGRDPALAPVYRFWSAQLGDHFYTIDETEKDNILRLYPDSWSFEGIAFYAYPPDRAPIGSKPIYRFWSDRLGHHSYAITENEKQRLTDDSKQGWTCEGVAWYAFD